jgi:hypothetical protein
MGPDRLQGEDDENQKEEVAMTKHFLLCLICALGLGRAMASDLDFTLVNDTNRSFEAVYLSATSNKDWNGNLLPDGKPLAAHGQIAVLFKGDAKSPTWDLNVVDSDGLAVEFKALKLTGEDTVTLKTEDGKITAVVE